MGRPKKPTLSIDEILALKELAKFAATLTAQPQAPVITTQPVKQKKKSKSLDNSEAHGAGQSTKLKERKKSKGATRHEPIDTKSRINLFEQSSDFNQFKADSEIDRKLWQGKSVSRRGDRQTIIEVECESCGNDFTVCPNELIVDADGNSKYRCNDCQLERRS